MFLNVELKHNPSILEWALWTTGVGAINIAIGAGILYFGTKIVKLAWLG